MYSIVHFLKSKLFRSPFLKEMGGGENKQPTIQKKQQQKTFVNSVAYP